MQKSARHKRFRLGESYYFDEFYTMFAYIVRMFDEIQNLLG